MAATCKPLQRRSPRANSRGAAPTVVRLSKRSMRSGPWSRIGQTCAVEARSSMALERPTRGDCSRLVRSSRSGVQRPRGSTLELSGIRRGHTDSSRTASAANGRCPEKRGTPTRDSLRAVYRGIALGVDLGGLIERGPSLRRTSGGPKNAHRGGVEAWHWRCSDALDQARRFGSPSQLTRVRSDLVGALSH